MKKYELPQQEKDALERLRQPFAIYQFIGRRVVTLVLSDGFCKLFGYSDRESAYYDMDHDMYKYTHPDDVARISNAAIQFAMEDGVYEVVYRSRQEHCPDYTIVHAMGEHVYTDDGVRLAHVWYTDEGRYEEDSPGLSGGEAAINTKLSFAIHEQSIVNSGRYDHLTGLPSMTYFFELTEAGKEIIRRAGGQPMLLYMDFSGMQFFNTRHGFSEGDKMLQSFARIIARIFDSENCCRIGGDHFAALTEDEGLEDKLNTIFKEFGELFDGRTPPVHVGIYPYLSEDVKANVACDRAKMACNKLKGTYSSGFNYYSPALRQDMALRQYIIENIDTAIRERWIRVYLQPIIRAVNTRVCDVEVLARWDDPERGLLSPAHFIPALEDAGLIYKLDLFMVEQVLELIKMQMAEDFFVVPHSINLSRSDFDSCDIVEEIRKRVDDAGISRDKITIEITESVIGRDIHFMKEQIERFRSLGFPVWMDDFGSGYSSLDALQNIQFDLIKFDRSFMKKLDEGEEGKVILTELMRMTTSLGLDTVCEGVETESQAQVLKEIGCSKLQGFHYSKPMPFELIREKVRNNTLILHENPEESDYYESISRVNLFDLGVVASDENSALHNVFDTIPIAVLEINGNDANYIRNNHSYEMFARRYFNVGLENTEVGFGNMESGYEADYISVIRQCCRDGNKAFFDGKLPDGSVAHFFIQRISSNPVTGSMALVIAVLSVSEPDDSTTYAEIARALASDYYNIYVIDLDTNDYTEYSSQVGGEELSILRRGKDFFESARRDTMTRIYEEDRESFLELFTKEKVLEDLRKQGVFTTTYRLVDTGRPMYVNMKINRMTGSNRIILGVSIIDAHMKQRRLYEQLQKERDTLARLMALSDGYLSLYTVNPRTGRYVEYSSSEAYESLGVSKSGDDFFGQAYANMGKVCYEPDLERFRDHFSEKQVLDEVREKGSFSISYRLVINKVPRPVTLKAVMVTEKGEEKLIVSVRAWKDRK